MEEIGFWSRARNHPARVALVEETEQCVTAETLLVTSNRIANRLLANGMQRGDVVAALLPFASDLVALMLATRQIGLYLLPLNPRAGVNELDHLVRDSARGC